MIKTGDETNMWKTQRIWWFLFADWGDLLQSETIEIVWRFPVGVYTRTAALPEPLKEPAHIALQSARYGGQHMMTALKVGKQLVAGPGVRFNPATMGIWCINNGDLMGMNGI